MRSSTQFIIRVRHDLRSPVRNSAAGAELCVSPIPRCCRGRGLLPQLHAYMKVGWLCLELRCVLALEWFAAEVLDLTQVFSRLDR